MRITDQRLKCCIAITKHAFTEMEATGHVYMYSSPEEITLVDSARERDYEFDDFADFMERMSPKEMADLSVTLGIRLEFKSGTKEDLAAELWTGLCLRADDRRAAKPIEKRNPLTGQKRRGRKKQDLSSRRYIILDTGDDKKALLDDAPVTTRQAKKIWEFFLDEYFETGKAVVTEARMQNIVNDRAEELRTRQDPWRIFQYYRPELIDCQLIKLEK